jgi:uncharacterized protein YsxB (DUF464 family)
VQHAEKGEEEEEQVKAMFGALAQTFLQVCSMVVCASVSVFLDVCVCASLCACLCVSVCIRMEPEKCTSILLTCS